MKFPEFIRKRIEDSFKNAEDPIAAEKDMISRVQKFVGIHNVFGDHNRRCSFLDLLAIVIFVGAHSYIGSLSQFVYLIEVFPDKVETFKVLNCVSATSVPLSKFIFMVTARSRLKTIFEMSREGISSIPVGSAAEKAMLSTLLRGRYASWLVVFNQGVTHVVYLLVPFLFTVFGNDRYLPTTPGDAYGLTPKYETPFYEATFALMTLGTFFSVVNQIGYIILFVVLMAHELGHFYCITETLKEICNILSQKNINAENRKSIDIKLKFCVKQHQFLLKFHDKVRELYRAIFGTHFLLMTVVVITTLQTLNQWDIRNTILTGFTGILPLFIYCFGGELLVSAGSEMSTAVYSCGWEFMEVKQARVVLLMLCMSQRPLCLTAADIFVMNRETFGDVAQVVYKVYAVFN